MFSQCQGKTCLVNSDRTASPHCIRKRSNIPKKEARSRDPQNTRDGFRSLNHSE